ncbi:protein kinase domain-containing protein [Streptomyces scabiei]|uniref:protein kinase domain-containing protein n=1 Tax=Streptomyces scabiei TaxID=1930 RepID=UPI0029B3A7F7|nr:protein kinase [Streptomyces scabiei]MDX3521323.1 protein kinase [Streptomyces scabiei]
MLAMGDTLRTSRDTVVTVAELIGSGGQGEVYRVVTAAGDKALKWYYPAMATEEQRSVVRRLISIDLHDDRFLWPERLIEANNGFGYLMPLRPARFRGLPDLFRRTFPVTYRTLLAVAVQVGEAYRELHHRGIAYRDISWGNVFFDPSNGEVLICDNDNAIAEGLEAQVLGSVDFMAPELVRAEPGRRPGTQTDLYALAVLLFMLLTNSHPLHGRRLLRVRCLDGPAIRLLYGTDPLFVFDPDSDDNRPAPGEQDTVLATWAVLPAALRELFVHSFTVGLRYPDRRIRESQWIQALSQVRDAILVCPACGRLNLVEPEKEPGRCWSCATQVLRSPVLEITVPGGSPRRVRLSPEAEIHPHHFQTAPERHDFTTAVARVTPHPHRPAVHGLTNLSASSWTFTYGDTERDVAPGQTVNIRPGTRLFLHNTEAVVLPP